MKGEDKYVCIFEMRSYQKELKCTKSIGLSFSKALATCEVWSDTPRPQTSLQTLSTQLVNVGGQRESCIWLGKPCAGSQVEMKCFWLTYVFTITFSNVLVVILYLPCTHVYSAPNFARCYLEIDGETVVKWRGQCSQEEWALPFPCAHTQAQGPRSHVWTCHLGERMLWKGWLWG
jgi:hypothetical protein